MTTKTRRGTADDAHFLASIPLSSSRAHLPRGVWDLTIGKDDKECLEYISRLVVVEPKSLYHYESFQVAEIEGTQAAALGGFPLEASRWTRVSEALSQVQQSLGWTEADLAASQQRTAPVWSCFLADVGADWGIENVAVLPEFRGQGAVDSLLKETVHEARAKGFKLAQVSTYIGNDQAMAVYERAGFPFSDEKRCETLEAALGTPGSCVSYCQYLYDPARSHHDYRIQLRRLARLVCQQFQSAREFEDLKAGFGGLEDDGNTELILVQTVMQDRARDCPV